MVKKLYEKTPVWVAYTILFAAIVTVTFGTLHQSGATTIWNLDGIAQHYPILREFYRILHGTTHQSLFSWSWNLGLGANQMTTFAYYVVGDPFSYLIALFSADKIEFGYWMLTLLRLYVVGLSFMALAKQLRLKRAGTLFGSLIYTFNGFTFYVSFHHPFFLLPLIFFPLLCLFIDRIYHGHSSLGLTIVTALALVSNLYFAYVLAIGAFIFAIVRYFELRQKHVLNRSIIRTIGTFLLALIGALLLASVILIPVIISMLHSSRSGAAIFANGLTTYPALYYLRLPAALINANGTVYYWTILGLSGITLMAIIWPMRRFKRYWVLNTLIILTAVGLLLPQIAAIMNVMSTPSNRWLLLAQLLFAIVSAVFIDRLSELTVRDFYWFMGSAIALALGFWCANGFIFKTGSHFFMSFGLFLTVLLIIAVALLKPLPATQLKSLLLLVITINLMNTGLGFYSSNYSDAPKNEVQTGTAAQWTTDFFDKADQYLKKMDHTFYRTATSSDYYTTPTVGNNISMLLGTHSISSYYSVQSGYVDAFNRELGNAQTAMNNPTGNADNRTTMLNLLGVKYLFTRQDDWTSHAPHPYGFNAIKTKNGQPKLFADHPVYQLGNGTGTILLKNKNALPLAYLQSKQLNKKAFNRLSQPDKEQALLTGAQTDNPVSGIGQVTPKKISKTVPYSVTTTSLPVTTLQQAIGYRLDNNVNQSLSAKHVKNADQLTPKEAAQYAAATNLTHPSKTVTNLLKQNQQLITKNQKANQSGLTTMTSDLLGQRQTYQLTLKQPQRYKNCELYVELSGIKASFASTSDRQTLASNRYKMAGTPFTKSQRLNSWRTIVKSPFFDSYDLTVSVNHTKTDFTQLGINNMSDYEPKHQLLLNMGYSTRLRKTISLSFTNAKQLHFKRVRIIAVPFGRQYRQETTHLQRQALNHLTVTNNHVSGTSSTDKPTILTTSIPYSSGWHLTVDGRATTTQQVNSGFVGARIPAGRHRIKLTYTTPGLKIGFIATLIGVFFLAGLIIWVIFRRRTLSKAA
ncbi:hypothetical protein AYR62_02130 [Secundilactobacillus paracollinoides]|uniref:YfhO family protein n=1 Tax=Secundilactobacillus paracollinoides TaxID=240427 RepID=UPI00081A5592|nr:YfhO family protein [Secundilactobacillus paracollinoides]ANZ63021.1 hypothetical protein AYR62_02130 [Secundilactobacillus paracollinoides]